MNWFKRLCMFLFGLAGLVSLVALSATWVGPWTAKARSMLELPLYLMTLEICVCVTVAGLLACLLVAIFYPRNPKETIVAKVEGGEITVTRHAIVSQVRHVVESDGLCKASSIRVRVRKRGNVRVNVRVKPSRPIDVIAYGERLYERLSAGLAEVCGDSVKSINVVFAEPTQVGEEATSQSAGDVTVTPAGVDGAQAASPEGISVNPSTFATRVAEDGPSDDSATPTIVFDSFPEDENDVTDGINTAEAADGEIREYSWEPSDGAGATAQVDAYDASVADDGHYSLEHEEV